MNPPVLGHPNFNLPFLVYTDVSEVCFGAELVEQTELGNKETLAYCSHSLNPAKKLLYYGT